MSIVGKIVGGTIGLALGGPLGAILGAVFGHAFDGSIEGLEDGQDPHLSTVGSTQLAFFVATFSMLAKLAQADGRVSEQEIETVNSYATQRLGLSASDRHVAFNIFRAALASPASFEDFAHQFYMLFQREPQMLEMMIDFLLRVSIADGDLNAAEEQLILDAVRIFNLDAQSYRTIKSRYIDLNDQAYGVLGCHRDDPDSKIKAKYRTLVQSYHPDKITAKGLPEEFTKLAEEKFREIQEAYEKIKAERGIK